MNLSLKGNLLLFTDVTYFAAIARAEGSDRALRCLDMSLLKSCRLGGCTRATAAVGCNQAFSGLDEETPTETKTATDQTDPEGFFEGADKCIVLHCVPQGVESCAIGISFLGKTCSNMS